MKRRLLSLGRVLSVEKQLHRVAEAKLAELIQREAALQAAQEDLFRALNAEQPLHGMFVGMMARQLRALSEDSRAVKEAREAQARLVLDRCGRVKRAERLAGSVEAQNRQTTEKRQLAELIEAAVNRPASLP